MCFDDSFKKKEGYFDYNINAFLQIMENFEKRRSFINTIMYFQSKKHMIGRLVV